MSDIKNNHHLESVSSQPQSREDLLRAKIGRFVQHIAFGIGIIESIELLPQKVYLNVRFANDEQASRKFTTEALSNFLFFTDPQVPTELQKVNQLRIELQQQSSHAAIMASNQYITTTQTRPTPRQILRWRDEEWRQIENEWKQFEKNQRQQVIRRQRLLEQQRRQEEQRKEYERIQREQKKQILLSRLRQIFEYNFLKAYDFYRLECMSHVSEEEYEQEKLKLVDSWVSRNLESKPDRQQVTAIAATERHIQVIARAGSGKTTTVVNRALFLQQHCGVAPHEILLLAFNRKAAQEVRERLSSKLQGSIPHVMTFHALAYALVHPEKAILVDEPDGEQTKSRALQAVIDEYLHTDEGYEQIRSLMLLHFREDWERITLGGYDRSRDDMLKYRRSLPKEGIDGTYLKSYGEKVIADFLFEHDIKYKYEQNFWWNGTNYRPDFTVFTGKDEGVVIEYFGLEGDPDYDETSAQKRRYWQGKPTWQFIEFSSHDLRHKGKEGVYRALQQELENRGIPCNRLTDDEIWERIKERAIDRFTKVMEVFVRRCRKLSLTPEQLAAMIHKHSCTNDVEYRFINLGQVFYRAYLKRRQVTGEEDFDGLLQQAAGLVASGQTVFRRKSGSGDLQDLRYIFIDEYQDFSDLFYRLVEAIRTHNERAFFFCVGDDWQAINGFAGSDLQFYQNFTTLFRPARQLYITTNYRSAKSIVKAGNVLMQGLGITAHANSTRSGTISVADITTLELTPQEQEIYGGNRLTPAVLRLVHHVVKEGDNVVLLNRKNALPRFLNYADRRNTLKEVELDYFLKAVHSHLEEHERKKVSISTTHKFKGLEKHTVILLDAIPRHYPLIHPDLMLTRILGDSVERTVAEERRLFYVALTRAVERLIIITEKGNFSPFLDDLRGIPGIFHLKWSQYLPAPEATKRITIRVGNQMGRGNMNTFVIKDLLSNEGYQWKNSGWQNWWQRYPEEGFSVRQFINEASWSSHADGIEVQIFDHKNNMIATYQINAGQWHCGFDMVSGI